MSLFNHHLSIYPNPIQDIFKRDVENCKQSWVFLGGIWKQKGSLIPSCYYFINTKACSPFVVSVGINEKLFQCITGFLYYYCYWQAVGFLRDVLSGTLKFSGSPGGPVSFPIIYLSKNKNKSRQTVSFFSSCSSQFLRQRSVQLFKKKRKLVILSL